MRYPSKFFLAAITVLLCLLSMKVLVRADAGKKTVKVNIEKEYTSCTFTVSMKDDGNYTVSLISPDGDRYNCSPIDSQNFKCTVDSVYTGTWKVSIKNKSGDVGRVSVSVKASRNEDHEILSDIRIGKDIVGLREYLKDDSICVEWSDTTVGNVNIRIVNLDNNQILANETVAGQYYECTIPTGVQNIAVSVVPSSSASIDGAEKTFTIFIDNHPDVSVVFPDEYFFSANSLTVKMILNKDYGYMLYDNGRLITESSIISAGTYDLEIPFSKDGEHELMVYIVDAAGNMRSYSAVFNRDTSPPYVTMEKEYNGMSVSEETLIVAGSIKDYQSLAINEKQIIPATDGHFEFTCDLHEGDNHILLTAADAAGNLTEYDMTVSYFPADTFRKGKIAMVALIILLLLICAFLKRYRKKAHISGSQILEKEKL